MKHLRDQHVLILGLGISGLAMARWCARHGARVSVADTRCDPPKLAALRAQLPEVEFVHAAFDAGLAQARDVRAVFVSPGLSPVEVADVKNAAQSAGLWWSSELGLFTQALVELGEKDAYVPKVLAVTGTNGKTTVTSLTGQLVEHCGKSVAVAGNIGPSLLDVLTEKMDAQSLPEVWVLELSSFQLEGCEVFEPTAATVLNVAQDHLDWHGSMDAYVRAKAGIFGAHGLMVLNRDDEVVMRMLPEPVRAKRQKPQQRAHVTFGADVPRRHGDYGIEQTSAMAWLVRAIAMDETRRHRAEEEVHVQRLMPADALRIQGRHNALNALAALALAEAAGCALAPMLYGLREYRGEPHRVQSIGVLNQVEYFDDSKGTNVGATAAALQGLGASGRRITVILGGLGKGQDFSALAPPVARYARAAVLMGQDAEQIAAALNGTGVLLLKAASMEQAVQLAAQQSRAGDVVLMSPACASMDMFRDYAHRAQAFVDAVRSLADDAGVILEGSCG